MSAIFPSAVATSLQLLTAVNNTKVTLTVAAGIGDTTLTVDDASPLPTSGYVTFDDDESNPETILYTGISGNNITGITRAADGTAAGPHLVGANLEQRWNAAYHNMTTTEIIAVEQYLSDRFGIGSNVVVPSGKSFTLAKTSSQLIFGTTNTTTVSATAPASSAVYTIPDVGTSANFVMSAGTQTIAGAKTFSNAAIFSSTISAAGAVTITPVSNQLILGGAGSTNTVTITAPTPGTASRTWTVPDITGNGTFAALEGTQTFSGAKTFSATLTMSGATIAMGGNKVTGAAAATANGDLVRYEQVSGLWGYRRPVLQYASTTVVNMETGINGTSGSLTILFPNGTLATDTTAGHFNIDMSRVASSSQSGLRTGSVANNTWYACYATLSGSNIIGIADTVLPLQANYSTLNANFGTNLWVYIGMIRCGDGSVSSSILKFVQAGNKTIFFNLNVSGNAMNCRGIVMATSGSAASLSYTYSAGTSGAVIPNHIQIVDWVAGAVATSNTVVCTAQTDTKQYFRTGTVSGDYGFTISNALANDGVTIATGGACDVFLVGYIDGVLGVSGNPLL